MKKLITAILAVAIGTSCFAFAGCNKSKVDSSSPETLEVYIYNAGYDTKWLDDVLAAFAEEDWVKEKRSGKLCGQHAGKLGIHE